MTNPRPRHLRLVHSATEPTPPRPAPGPARDISDAEPIEDFLSWLNDDEEDGHCGEDEDGDVPVDLSVVADPTANPTWHTGEWQPTIPELATMLRWIGAEHRARRTDAVSPTV